MISTVCVNGNAQHSEGYATPAMLFCIIVNNVAMDHPASFKRVIYFLRTAFCAVSRTMQKRKSERYYALKCFD